MRVILAAVAVFTALAAVEYHFYAMEIQRLDLKTQAQMDTIQAKAAQWHCEHQLRDCVKRH